MADCRLTIDWPVRLVNHCQSSASWCQRLAIFSKGSDGRVPALRLTTFRTSSPYMDNGQYQASRLASDEAWHASDACLFLDIKMARFFFLSMLAFCVTLNTQQRRVHERTPMVLFIIAQIDGGSRLTLDFTVIFFWRRHELRQLAVIYSCTTFGLFVFFPRVFLSSGVTGACPVTTDLIMRVNVRTTTTTTTTTTSKYGIFFHILYY